MSDEKFERELRGANPVAKQTLEALDLADGEASLGEAITAEPGLAGAGLPLDAPRPRRRSLPPLIAGATAIAAAVVVFIASGGASSSPEPAYGAQLVRFAESTPLLLLEGSGWRVQNVNQYGGGRYAPRSTRGAGSMEFVTGKPIPYASTRISSKGVSGMAPPSVRQRKVELSWRHGKLEFPAPVRHPIPLPVLDTTAYVNTKAGEIYIISRARKRVLNRGRPGDRTMAAIWREGSYVLELRAAVPDLAAFRERLGWLHRVDASTWLDAMPAKVVKAADHDAAVREMLKGIPVPSGFEPSRIPDEGLTTNRYQVGASVTGIVSCLWFRQWGEARRAGDHGGAAEAERAMATAKRWPILREMAKEGGYPDLVWQLAAAMPSGEWPPRGWPLLPHAEGLGCARWGLPVLPWKQRRQEARDGAS